MRCDAPQGGYTKTGEEETVPLWGIRMFYTSSCMNCKNFPCDAVPEDFMGKYRFDIEFRKEKAPCRGTNFESLLPEKGDWVHEDDMLVLGGIMPTRWVRFWRPRDEPVGKAGIGIFDGEGLLYESERGDRFAVAIRDFAGENVYTSEPMTLKRCLREAETFMKKNSTESKFREYLRKYRRGYA